MISVRRLFKIILAIPVVVAVFAVSMCIIGQYTTLFLLPEVWSQNSPEGISYEFKVNEFQCSLIQSELERGFLSGIDAVRVIAPDGEVYWLNRELISMSTVGRLPLVLSSTGQR